jgi:hypothetical protein
VSRVFVTPADDGHCPAGGIRVQVGVDADGNGALEGSELESTNYVCNGTSAGGGAGSGGTDAGTGTPPEAGPPLTIADLNCPIFPPDNAWNTDISGAPVDPLSDVYLSNMGTTGPNSFIRFDVGDGINGGGFPFVVVPATQPLVPIFYGNFGADFRDESDPGPYPLPLDAPIQGATPGFPVATENDRHVIALQQSTCRLFELYSATPYQGGFDCASSSEWDLTSNALRPLFWTSGDAAGLPIFPGLLRYDELASGEITHALRFTTMHTQNAFVAPARHAAGAFDATLPPMGLRVRLKASFDETTYPPLTQVFIRALKRYGMILADNGSDWFVSGTVDSRFPADLISSHIPASALEVIATGPITVP